MDNTKTGTPRKTFSIKTKVVILCTIFIMTAVIISNSALVMISKKAIADNTETSMEDLAAAYSKNVSDTIDRINQQSNMLMATASAYITSGNTGNTVDIDELASMYLSMNASVEQLNIIDADGNIVYSSDTALKGTNVSEESYYKEMASSGLSAESDVYSSASSGDAVITFAVPLRTGMGNMPLGAFGPMTTGSSTEQNGASTEADDISGAASTVPAGEILSPDMPGSTETAVEEFTGAITTVVKATELSSAIAGITVGDYKTGYAFILDSNGTFVAYPDEAVIGNKADAEGLNTIIDQIKTGTNQTSGVITYTYDGVVKYAGYYVDPENSWSLFLNVDQADVMANLKNVTTKSLFLSIPLIIILVLSAYLFIGTITRSIKKITALINKTAALDFTDDNDFKDLSLRRDETGEMSRAIEQMRSIMKAMIHHLNDVSGRITQSAEGLNTFSLNVNDHASDNSATAEQLSASMEETAATSEQIYSSIEQIGSSSGDINAKASYGSELSDKLISRALELKSSAAAATERTKKIYEEVKGSTETAIEQSKAVAKINYFTNAIKEIASQTSLLALNASIEAARAGDAGKGFSVVAGEIGSLADQSARTVGNITKIVEEVNEAVTNMTKSLKQTLDFLERNVLEDYKVFNKNSEQYHTAAVSMNETMDSIHKEIDLLNCNVQSISDSIAEITSMVNEASKGINDVAEKNMDIVALTSNTREMAKENADHADGLKEIVEKFIL
jgi:methyl-accepting chemotaxis protein